MATLKYRVNSGGAPADGQSPDDVAEASRDRAELSVDARHQAPEYSQDGDMHQGQAERLIEEIEILGSSCDTRPAPAYKAARGRDPGCMLPGAENLDQLLPPLNADRNGSARPSPNALEPSVDGQHWVLPSLLVVLTIGLGIFFLVSFSEVGDYSSRANGARSPAASALDNTRSKLSDLNRQVVFWMSRNADGFDPYSVTLKRVREDLNLSSDQMLDSWGRPIRYEAAQGRYTLRSSGPDKAFNTGDDLLEPQPPVPSRM